MWKHTAPEERQHEREHGPQQPDGLHRALLAISACANAMKLPWFVKTETFVKTKSFPEIKPHLDAHTKQLPPQR